VQPAAVLIAHLSRHHCPLEGLDGGISWTGIGRASYQPAISAQGGRKRYLIPPQFNAVLPMKVLCLYKLLKDALGGLSHFHGPIHS
jgi:hypothetical protein